MGELLEGRIAVVTGGGSGIGRAISSGYARKGARVVVLDANAESAAETEKSITAAGGQAWSFKLDVTQRDSCGRVAIETGSSTAAKSKRACASLDRRHTTSQSGL
jgi:NAD(P)-dependent dehydrogenase (short-subunit alcohol dehydrogenase family)